MRTKMKLLVIACLISLFGISAIYTNTYLSLEKVDKPGVYDGVRIFLDSHAGKQTIWLLVSIVLFLFVSEINYRKLWDFAYIFYWVILILLVGVFILGSVRLGAQRWLKLWIFNFQPSEFAKLCLVLVLARYYSLKDMSGQGILNKGFYKSFVFPFLIVSFPAILVVKQPDLGSAIMLMVIFFSISFVSRVPLKVFFILLGIFILISPFVWNNLENYQKQRLLVFINPNSDPLGAGYTVVQSKIAVGAGKFLGKGWLLGTQSQLHFLPEAHTDFIFATWAEERGFVGSAVLVGLYFYLITLILEIAEKAYSAFGKLICVGIASMFAVQICANILMTIGWSPVVGLPLLFMSYGGSSLLISFVCLAIIANIDKIR